MMYRCSICHMSLSDMNSQVSQSPNIESQQKCETSSHKLAFPVSSIHMRVNGTKSVE